MKRLLLALAVAASAATATAADGLDKTAAELVAEMSPGWNLGNTLEATRNWAGATLWNNLGGVESETAWQSTRTTPELIDLIKAEGFRSVRIPVAWAFGHISNPATHTIDSKWMARVREVVDYCIDRDLYVVLNDHWDGGWLENNIKETDPAKIERQKLILGRLWTQIATEFRDYDEHLLFAGLNEPNADDAAQTALLLAYEQVFVDAVRATGGNNLRRTLVVQGPNTDFSKSYDFYDTFPTDPTPDRMMFEVHYYTPWQFCGMDKDESWGKYVNYWGEGNIPAGTRRGYNGGEAEMDRLFGLMKSKYTDRGMPVIIGEYAALQKNVSGAGEDQTLHDASVAAFYKRLNEWCRDAGMVSFAWDTNNCSRPTSTIIDRRTLRVYNQHVMDAIRDVYASTDGITDISADGAADTDAAAVYYNLQGARVTDPAPGLYIVVRGRRVTKEYVR